VNTAVTLRRDAQPLAPRRRRWRLAAVGVGPIALVAAVAFLAGREPAVAAPQPMLPKPVREQILAMSTGAHQALVVTGENAQQRNALIPLAGEPLARMPGFAVVPAASPQYATALKCLTQAIYYEAANEPELGKRAVAQVVINRLRHPAYPKSVCGVVYDGANAAVCQFSFTCDGALLRAPMPRQWADSRRVAEQALAGTVVPEVGSATNYHADYVLPRWAFTLGKITQIATHIFYRFPGRIGSADVFTGRWSGIERIPALDYERLRRAAAAELQVETPAEVELVPNLTVTPDVKDRHAENDVGGRLDTNTGWRLSIPDPVQLSASYRSAVSGQGDEASVPLSEAKLEGEAKAAN
jgi:hypothetical protein